MWIVRVALHRPYTFIVLALLILIASPVVLLRTATDIFPSIDIPVIAVAWQFTGLNPEEMEGRITTQYERILTTTVDNIEHIESTTVNGQAMVKIFLQPNARLDTANAQVTAVSQTILRQLPPGIQPPLIINYSASTVPILQLALSGLSESELNDVGLNFLRTQLVTVPGASIPYPYGGRQRQVMVDLDPRLLQAKGLAPADVVTTLGLQNIVLPSGTAKIGGFEYDVAMNASPRTVPELNDLPVKVVGNSTIYLRDVAHVRDGFAPQTNVVRQDGRRGTLVTILKTGSASTLDVVRGIRNLLPRVIPTLPPELKIQPLADQSVFVRAAVSGLIREAVIFAMLASYLLSRTLVPTIARYLLSPPVEGVAPSQNLLARAQQAFERGFERVRMAYRRLLTLLVSRRVAFIPAFLAVCLSAFLLAPRLGENFFPDTDSGQFTLHLRGQTGTRIEETARLTDVVERAIRREIPAGEVGVIIDNIGMPYSSINWMHSASGVIGAADADVLVSLKADHRPTADYV